MKDFRVYILAGGLGTRLSSVDKNVHKVLMPVAGRPFLNWQLDWLKHYGCKDIVLMVGHLKEQIMSYYGNGRKFGLSINYSVEKSLLGTGGAFINALKKYPSKNFLLLNGDTYFPINLDWLFHNNYYPKAKVVICLKYLEDVKRYGLINILNNGVVTRFEEKSNFLNDGYINGGIYFGKSSLFDCHETKALSIEKDIFPNLVKTKSLYAIPFHNHFIDIGIPEDYFKANKFLNLWSNEKVKPALFLDRDGIIIKDKIHNNNINEFEFYEDIIKFLQQKWIKNFKLFIITNQSAIARGIATIKEVENANKYIINFLKKRNIDIDDVYYSPYHPEGIISKYSKPSLMRKPHPGMLLTAAENHMIDLFKSIMIGDHDSDNILLPYLKTVLLKRNTNSINQIYGTVSEINTAIISYLNLMSK